MSRPIDERTGWQIPEAYEHVIGFCRKEGCKNAWVRWGFCQKHSDVSDTEGIGDEKA